MDSERLDGPRQALSTCTHQWRHSIRHVTRIVTHIMDVNNRHGGSNYRCQACTFTIKRFHNGSCAAGVSYILIIFWQRPNKIRQGQIILMLQPQRQRTVFLTISVFRITSLLEWTATKLKSVQIDCRRNCNELCYTFNACFLDDFLMHSNVEYQCSSPCKYMNGSFLFLHMQSIWTMFGTNNNPDKVNKWEYMESQKRMTVNSHD